MNIETLQAGAAIGARFIVEGFAGSGGAGAVYRSRDRLSGESVAVKVLHRSGSHELARFSREAAVLASLEHPSIVRYIEHGPTGDGGAFLAMEWVEGEELGKLVKRRALTEVEALAIVRAAAAALAVAHARGIVHRDVKPGNLLIGRGGKVTLVDFGVALLATHDRLTRTGDVVGTPAYLSPEQARAESIDARSDVFSLGCVLYKCLTGRSPFGGGDILGVMTKILLQDPPPPSAATEGISPGVDQLVLRMLAKDRAERPADAAAVVDAIDALASPASAPSTRIGNAERSLFAVLLIERSDAPIEALVEIAGKYETRLEQLQTGALIVTPNGTGSFVDRAIRTARAALALRQPTGASMALVLGLGTSGGALPASEVIDRGVQLLRAARDPVVRVDADTAQLLEGAFDIDRDRGILLGEHAPFEATRTVLGRETETVGRARELTFLEHTIAHASEERSAARVWLTAGAGQGKSRVAYELLRRLGLGTAAIEVIGARADAASASTPYAFLAELVRRAAWIRDDDSAARRKWKLGARLQRHLAPKDAVAVGTFLGELVGAPLAEDLQLVAARRDPLLLSAGLARSFQAWLAAETAASPLLLVLEDAHFVDPATHRLFDRVLHALADRPLVVLALARTVSTERLQSLAAAAVIPLPRLGRAAATELVSAVLGADAEPAVVRHLVESGRGSVLHLEELIRAHARGTELSDVGVVAAMQGRVEALTPAQRRVLRAVSVFGMAASPAAVGAMIGDAPELVTALLEELGSAEILARRGRRAEHAFVQASLRDAVYATFTDDDRVLAHRLAAEWLERASPTDFDILADHYARARRPDREGYFSARAAEQAYARNDLEAAMVRAQRALALEVEVPQMLVLLAEARRHRGEFQAAYEHACAASPISALGTATWCDALGARAALAGLLSKYDEAAVIVDELLHASPRDDASFARRNALARSALAVMPSGRMVTVDRALAELDRDPPRLADDPVIFARVEGLRGSRAAYAGDNAGYMRASEASVRAFVLAGDVRGACIQRVHVGYAALSIGDYRSAEAVLREAASTADDLALPNIAATARQNLGACLARAGLTDEAIAVLADVAAVFDAQGDVAMTAATRLYHAEALERAGRIEEAEATIGAALAAGDVPSLRGALLALRARLLLVRGTVDSAVESARAAARALADVEGVEEGESLIRLALVETLRAAGDPSAEEALRVAAVRVRERAAAIEDRALRGHFLAISENARTLVLAG